MLFNKPKNTGFIEDVWDPRDIWVDELVKGTDEALPEEFLTDDLKFEPQGAYPFCGSFATITAIEHAIKKETGKEVNYSQPHLFFNCGGTKEGSSARGNLSRSKNFGLLDLEELPMPFIKDTTSEWEELKRKAFTKPGTDKILGYVRVGTNKDQLKRAIRDYGVVITGAYAGSSWGNNYWSKNHKRVKSYDTHLIDLVGWDEDGTWDIFDSLQPSGNFNGYHRFHNSYTFNFGYVITAISKDTIDSVNNGRKDPYQTCLDHYGKQRDLAAEIAFANKMYKTFEKYTDKRDLDAAGPWWSILINMGVYAGYNLEYYKWGRWHSGDLINFVVQWRRSGFTQTIFNPNLLRSEHK